MRLFISLLATILTAALLLFGAFLYFVHDSDQLRPELEALASDYADADVSIDGDIGWQLFSPFRLEMSEISIAKEDDTYGIGKLSLELDLHAIWQDIDRWRVKGLELNRLSILQADSRTDIADLLIRDFTFGEPVTFEMIEIVHQTSPDADGHDAEANDAAVSDAEPGEQPFEASVSGRLIYSPATDKLPESIGLRETQIQSSLGSGVCELDATRLAQPVATPVQPKDAVLPIDLLMGINLVSECSLSNFYINEESFSEGTLNISNMDGQLTTYLNVGDFFDGQLSLEAEVDLLAEPLSWRVTPDLTGVDSQRYLDWTERSYKWLALANATGRLQFKGNTVEHLQSSAQGLLEFDADDGEINVAKLKQQLTRVAVFTGDAEKMASRPDLWNYKTLRGSLRIDGKDIALSLLLDNLSAEATGSYNLLTDLVDLRGTVTLAEPSPDSPFVPNPILQDTPIPARCRGATSDISCRMDSDAAKTLLASALKQNSDTGLRRKLEEKIEEKVPEEYRETARGLLDLLGRALDQDN